MNLCRRREAVGGAVRFSHLHGGVAPEAPPAGLRLRRQGGEVRQRPRGRNRQTVRPPQRLLKGSAALLAGGGGGHPARSRQAS